MDIIRQDIIYQLNELCTTYRRLQDYFSKNNVAILQELEQVINKYHNDYQISDICNTNFTIDELERNKMYAFLYHINNDLGFYEFLEMYNLDYPKYNELKNEAYKFYYQYALDNMLPSQVDITRIDWKMVKAYKEENNRLITDFFKRV